MVIRIEKEHKNENKLKDFWKWLGESDSWLSYIVFLVIVFIFVKFIFLPTLGFVFGLGFSLTSLPLAIVESSSMDHNILDETGVNEICGKTFDKKQFLDSKEYWNNCGLWYEQNTNITEEQFQTYSFKNGFRKGDLIIIFGKNNIEVGEVIIFNAGRNHPVIHRVISLNPIQTKGDHNSAQLSIEQNIAQNQVIGTAVARIPYIGWIKLFFVEIFNGFK